MSEFTDNQLTNWAQSYEKEICAKFNFIADRISIPITSGVGIYEIPNYIVDVRMVLYKGKELHPKGGRQSIITGDLPFATSTSSPYEYQTSGMGLRTLRLLPTPEENVPLYVGDLFTVDADRAGCIVEFYRTPCCTLMLPPWFRRYVLKDYICFKAFSKEGPTQDLRGATYYENRRLNNEMYLAQIRSNLLKSYVHVLADHKMLARRKPGHPILPTNFGYNTFGG